MGEPAVFLDRDGVINPYVYNPEFGTVDSPSNPDEFQLNPGVREAIDALRAMGFLIIVVSNQPGIAKGKFTPGLLDATTAKCLRDAEAKSTMCITAFTILKPQMCSTWPNAFAVNQNRGCCFRLRQSGRSTSPRRLWSAMG